MTTFPNSPRLLKGGIVLIDPESGAVKRVIALQYNPDTLTRSLQPKTPGESADRSEALRLKGPPVETIKLDAEIDATDQLEQGQAAESGIYPQLAALEIIVYPTERATGGEQRQGQERHAGDHTDHGAADALRLEQEPGGARADHRLQHHRRSV